MPVVFSKARPYRGMPMLTLFAEAPFAMYHLTALSVETFVRTPPYKLASDEM